MGIDRRVFTRLLATASLAGCMSPGNPARSETDEEPSDTGIGTTPSETSSRAPTATPQPEEWVIDVVPPPGLERSSMVFDAFSSDQRQHQMAVDLEKREERHSNDLDEVLSQEAKWKPWLSTIPDDDKYVANKENTQGALFPEREGSGSYERFYYEKFNNTENLQDSLDWLHSYLFAWDMFGLSQENNALEQGEEKPYSEEVTWYPGEHDEFSPLLERAIEEYAGNSCHFWPVEVYEVKEGGTYNVWVKRDNDHRYGMMQAWDIENDEMLLPESMPHSKISEVQHEALKEESDEEDFQNGVMDEARFDSGRQIHPKTTNSVMLPETGWGSRGSLPVEDYWNTLRFDGSEPDVEGLDYRTAALITARNMRRAAATELDGDITRRLGEDANVAVVNGYLDDVTDIQAEPSEYDLGFQDFYDQAMMLDMLAEADGSYVVFGNPGSRPLYARVEDDSVIDRIWEDEEGQFDDFAKVRDSLEPVGS